MSNAEHTDDENPYLWSNQKQRPSCGRQSSNATPQLWLPSRTGLRAGSQTPGCQSSVQTGNHLLQFRLLLSIPSSSGGHGHEFNISPKMVVFVFCSLRSVPVQGWYRKAAPWRAIMCSAGRSLDQLRASVVQLSASLLGLREKAALRYGPCHVYI